MFVLIRLMITMTVSRSFVQGRAAGEEYDTSSSSG
jgi:hypothetical protein